MKRRTFIRLTGVFAMLGLPWVTQAGQSLVAGDVPVALGLKLHHQGKDLNEGRADEWPIPVIKVVGVGGAGGNAVEHLIREGCSGIGYICCDTDATALTRSSVPVKLQLGSGLGTGGRPDLARELAKLDRLRTAETLTGAHMVFITAGLGGGTGTGAAPVVEEVAREMGILTVAMVTKPFDFEGNRRLLAEDGAAELARHADALIVLPNEILVEAFGDGVSMREALTVADDILKDTITTIVDLLNKPGLAGIDFDDIRWAVTEKHGRASVGSATASGFGRSRRVVEAALTFVPVSTGKPKTVSVVSQVARSLRFPAYAPHPCNSHLPQS